MILYQNIYHHTRLWTHQLFQKRLGRTARAAYKSRFMRIPYWHIEHPKCGRSWLRVMINLAESMSTGVPVKNTLSNVFYPKLELPRVSYTHLVLPGREVDPGAFPIGRFRGYLFQVRDPRRVMVSWYNHCLHRDELFKGAFFEFVTRSPFGIDSYVDYVESVHDILESQNTLVVRYEDLLRSDFKTFQGVLEFLELKLDSESIHSIVEMCRFDNMKHLIGQTPFSEAGWLRPSSSAPNSSKVRSGNRESLDDWFDDELARHVNARVGESEIMARLGYVSG